MAKDPRIKVVFRPENGHISKASKRISKPDAKGRVHARAQNSHHSKMHQREISAAKQRKHQQEDKYGSMRGPSKAATSAKLRLSSRFLVVNR